MMRRARTTTTTTTRALGALLCALLGMSALTGCGAFGECEVPLGTYSVELVDAGGDCPDDAVRAATGVRDAKLEADDEEASCGSHSIVSVESNGSCQSRTTLKVTSHEDGLDPGTAELVVSCSGSQVCKHNFNVYFKKR